MIITRAVAGPNKWTFKIKPIAELVSRYVGDGKNWIDPFCGQSDLAEFRNDLDPSNIIAQSHVDAEDFCLHAPFKYSGVIFDPPYSYRQVSESYAGIGRKATALDTSNNFYNRVMNAICDKIAPEGYAISCGWNSNGFGRHRNFYPIELLVVAHGQHHNDTLVLVERKYLYPVEHAR